MLFPLGDDNPRRSTPVVTLLLIAANVAVYLGRNLGATDAAVADFCREWGYDASHPLGIGVLTSMFMHGGLLHIAGNLWVLWIFGDNVEDKLGKVRYLIFYLLGGILAAWSFSAIAFLTREGAESSRVLGAVGTTAMDRIPLVGASGAVMAVMGMYLVLFPEARVRLLLWLFFFVQIIRMPAKWFIRFSLAIDAVLTLTARGPAAGGVATAAHVGGGLFGIAAALALKRSIGGGGEGHAWDVHTGFSRSEVGGGGRASGVEPWFAPPEPMDDDAAGVEDALIELVRAGRLREAIDVYPGYVALRRERPLPADVQIEIAHEFYRQGLSRDGIRAYQRFLDTDPDDADAPEAAFRIGILYARGLGDAKSAVPWLRQAAKSHDNAQIAAYAEQELRRLGA